MKKTKRFYRCPKCNYTYEVNNLYKHKYCPNCRGDLLEHEIKKQP